MAHDVVDAARSELSPIHEIFEWDDTVAAENYRVWQARKLIATVKVTIENKEFNGYYNVKVVADEKAIQGYFTAQQVMSDAQIYNLVLDSALRELNFWKEKYKQIAVLSKVINEKEVKKLSAKVKKS